MRSGGIAAFAVVQLLETSAPYEDIYTWDIALIPSARMWENMNQDQRRQLASLGRRGRLLYPQRERLTNVRGLAPRA